MQRTNGIITNLSRYATPLKSRQERVDLKATIEHLLTLYQGAMRERGISVGFKTGDDATLTGDQHLLEEMLENLIKNAIEAQPQGGHLAIELLREDAMLAVEFENPGFDLTSEQAGRILSPSSPPRPGAPAWVWPSPNGSWKRTAAASPAVCRVPGFCI